MKGIKTLLLIIGLIAIIFVVYNYLQDREQDTKPVGRQSRSGIIITSSDDDTSSEPPTLPAPSEEEKRQTIAVKSWLVENGYSVSKSDNKYKIKGPRGTQSISVSGMPVSATGNLLITTDGKGNLKVAINNVGTGVFKVDTFGNLRPLWEENALEQGEIDLSEIIE